MKEMTLREIQLVGLDIMKDIHRFCEENNIRYTLAYGSLIGAVRHKGFIPWDDDVDIWMPRPDYEKFSKSYQSKVGFKSLSPFEDDNYFYFTKVYDAARTHVEMKLKHHKGDLGVWVDVFPIDGVSDDRDTFLADYAQIRKTRQKINSIRGSYTALSRAAGLWKIKEGLKMLVKRLLFGNIYSLRKKHEGLCSRYGFGQTKHCSSLCCVDAYKKNKPECFDTADFTEFVLADFETEKFYITKSYNHILRNIYGDYMVIPSKENQESHIKKDGEHFYWK